MIAATPAPDRMQCMEIHGGNAAIDQSFVAPGLNLHVHSAPYQRSESGGGDLYYLTSCASGRISRLLLADIAGHGKGAARLAISLRDLLRRNVNRIDQQRFVEQMNREFGELASENIFATAVVATYFAPRRQLSLSVAGHPHPIYYRRSLRRWVHLDPEECNSSRLSNLPLGIMTESSYPRRTIEVEHGDLILLYSDAFIESVRRDREFIGTSGVVQLLNEMEDPKPSEVVPALLRSIRALSEDNLADDDATLMLGEFTATGVRMRDNFLAPVRLLRGVGDRTSLLGALRS